MKGLNTIIPSQVTGNKTDHEYSKAADSQSEARQLFQESVARILDVNEWHKLCGTGSAVFQLTNETGEELNELIVKGRYIKIDIPGPGTQTGKGFDWVYVEDTDSSSKQGIAECYAIRVRPSSSPLTNNHSVAHFFKDEASSTFMVCRNNNTVTASIHGRNEIPNTSTGNKVDNIRNEVVAVSAMGVFSGVQWKKLVKGVINGLADEKE